jgi:hypothetical protein
LNLLLGVADGLDDHLAASSSATRDVDATMATMTDDPTPTMPS